MRSHIRAHSPGAVCATTALTALLILAWPGADARGQVGGKELTAKEIATRADRARRSSSEHNVMTMVLENHRGQQRVRTLEGWSREVSEEEDQRFSRFLEPSDVRDTTLLTYDYVHKDDSIWLYLPALKKVKRILSSNKKDYFMGSDFTYEDMENADLINWDFTLKGKEKVDGVDCYIVEAVPNNPGEAKETAYSKTVSWVGTQDFLARRADYYDKKGRLAKKFKTDDIHATSGGDRRLRAHKITMENLITRHKTILTFHTLELDIKVNDEIFSQRSLRQ